jgi:diacylglycerol kinase family enzyme
MRLLLEADGRPQHCRSPFVFVGNNAYVMEGFRIGTRSSLDRGRLSVYTTQRSGRVGLLRLFVRALFGRLHQADDFASALVRHLRVESRHARLLVATDGEVTAMQTPLEFRVRPAALQVFVPAA